MKKLLFIGFLLLFILSCGRDETGDNDNENDDSDNYDGSEVITFKDPNLEKCVRKKADKLEGELTVEDVKDVETLDCPRMNIKVLDGIEKLPNVNDISFYENDIVDFSILKNMQRLKKLNIDINKNVSPDTLSELNNIEELYAEDCELTTLDPIKNLSDLKVLSVASNSLDSLKGIENLTGLEFFLLNENYLENDDLLVLLNLDKLEYLNIEYNCVNDFSVFDQMKEKNPDLDIVYGGLNEECN